jgi:LDH2 family malate/lactate/ureidoglycolate dehydrogenase
VQRSVQHSEKRSAQQLRDLGSAAFEKLGVPSDDARLCTDLLVMADLFGLTTHGMSRLESYGERLRIGGIKSKPMIKIEQVANAVIKVDGDNGLGPVVGMRTLHATMALAREHGVGVGLARGSNHFGPISPYLYEAAQSGFACLVCSNATTTIAPWGGSDARLGNNPIGFGAPGPQGNHFMLDMAISVAARAKIRAALRDGTAIPSTWATDEHGLPTTDPAKALDGFLQPMGGYKGYGLALMVDLLAGVMSDASYLTHVKSWVDAPEEPQNLGHFFLLIDTKVLGSSGWLLERMKDFVQILHASEPADATRPVLVPGEIELSRMRERLREGIDVDAALLKLLR